MIEIICINDKYKPHERDMYDLYVVALPIAGQRYHLREFVENPDGTVGVLLDEIISSDLVIRHEIFHFNSGEPNWDLFRFRPTDKELRLKYRSLVKYYQDYINGINVRSKQEEII
jgi:hypothetical protein